MDNPPFYSGDVNYNGDTSYLPATSDTSATPLPSSLASSFGVANPTPTSADTGLGVQNLQSAPVTSSGPSGGVTDLGVQNLQSAPGTSSGPSGGGTDSSGGNSGGYFSSLNGILPNSLNNPATLGLLGYAAYTGSKQPSLPASLQTVNANNTTLNNQATNVVETGGALGPSWNAQKASIDAQYTQQLQQQTEAIQQAAANSGQSGLVVQQQLSQMQQNLSQQREQLYQQSMQANVNQAIQEIGASNGALGSVANTQLSQSKMAQMAALQIANLATKLGTLANVGNKAGSGAADPSVDPFGSGAGSGAADASVDPFGSGAGSVAADLSVDPFGSGAGSVAADLSVDPFGPAVADLASSAATDLGVTGATAAADLSVAGETAAAGSSGLAGVLTTVGTALGAVTGCVAASELCVQGRLNKRTYIAAMTGYYAWPRKVVNGYQFLGVPFTRYLRKKPYALLSIIGSYVVRSSIEYLANTRRKKPTPLFKVACAKLAYGIYWMLGCVVPDQIENVRTLYPKGTLILLQGIRAYRKQLKEGDHG